MASTVPFKLISPTRVVFQGDAELVIAVTTEGEEGILPKHAPFLAALRPGVLRANVVADGASQRLELATGEGFMQALPDRITVLVDDALAFDDVDVARAREDLAAATERQKAEPIESAAFAREQAAIDFAGAKLRLTGH
ncbi:MAG: ATP synthase F1 subunit epsilon [Candidatus Eremiobacteraeota bacterium]|nr:ATP synthase F1 subunit epsilon [Candidatus Eremiobacteraeota bacterium]MBV8283257.1 ATP synthase F1 subunit epsilon [Candidatus Eremiobacteraeota bacterium]